MLSKQQLQVRLYTFKIYILIGSSSSDNLWKNYNRYGMESLLYNKLVLDSKVKGSKSWLILNNKRNAKRKS